MIIETLFLLLAAHWLADYPLQGDFLAQAKAKGPLRIYHLVAHAGIQGAAVYVVTGSVMLGLAEWAIHTATDEAKTRNWISFSQDQVIHVGCKVVWAVLLYLSVVPA